MTLSSRLYKNYKPNYWSKVGYTEAKHKWKKKRDTHSNNAGIRTTIEVLERHDIDNNYAQTVCQPNADNNYHEATSVCSEIGSWNQLF